MNRKGKGCRRPSSYRLLGECLEDRRSSSAGGMVSALQENPVAFPATHPNTPVMPFATPTKKASFIDPTVQIEGGSSVVVGYQSLSRPTRRSTAVAARSRSGTARTCWTAPRSRRIPAMRIGCPAPDRRRRLDRLRGDDPRPEYDRRIRRGGRADRGRCPGDHRRRHDRARGDRLAPGQGRPRCHGTVWLPGPARHGRDYGCRGVQHEARHGREGDVVRHRDAQAGPRG